MLSSIINGESAQKMLIIEDSADNHADEIFSTTVQNIVKKHDKDRVVFVCSEKTEAKYRCKYNLPKNVQCIDLFKCTNSTNELTKAQSLLSILNLDKNDMNHVVIDSISPFLWGHPIENVSQELKILEQITENLVLRVRKDSLLIENHATLLKYLCKTHLKVVDRRDGEIVACVTHCRGRVAVKVGMEVCGVDERGQVAWSREHVRRKPVVPARVVPIESLTTFDLGVSLSQSEKQARDRLVLPYLRTSEDIGGEIEYTADDADLEEDPDDDLEL